MAVDQSTLAEPVDREFVDDFAEQWLAAWNSHVPERVLSLMTEDIVYDDSAWPQTMRGHAEVREFLEHMWRAFPDMRFEAVGGPLLDPDAPRAASYWRGTATHTGPLDPPGVAPTGRRLEFHGAEFDEYRDGKVARLQMVFNLADGIRELGGLPEQGSREERMLVRLGNLRNRLSRRG